MDVLRISYTGKVELVEFDGEYPAIKQIREWIGDDCRYAEHVSVYWYDPLGGVTRRMSMWVDEEFLLKLMDGKGAPMNMWATMLYQQGSLIGGLMDQAAQCIIHGNAVLTTKPAP